MTRYYKQTDDVYILAVGVGVGGMEISADEYSEILSIIQNRPIAGGKGYRLKTDLTWEEYDLPPVPEPSDDDEISNDEAINILLGGAAT